MEIGAQAIDFRLLGIDEKTYTLADFDDAEFLAVIFSCNHCPYVIASEKEMVELQAEFADKGVKFVAISANDPVQYPQDSFERMKERAEAKGFNFPYLFDETQEVARAYEAGRTPEIFLFNKERKLIYHGRINDNPKEHEKITRHDFRIALEEATSGKAISVPETQAIGCSIKWKQ